MTRKGGVAMGEWRRSLEERVQELRSQQIKRNVNIGTQITKTDVKVVLGTVTVRAEMLKDYKGVYR